jgi:prepilin-type N-terminal cleavage/methylation domain-containing protein
VTHTRLSRAAFTLVELLVVIGIIGLLIAILLPVLNKVRTQALELQCATNVRTLTQATLAYSLDNKGWLPDLGSGGSTGGRPYFLTFGWRDFLLQRFGLRRDNFYSPTNTAWNADEFWIPPGYGGSCVMGYYYWGNNPSMNTASILSQVQTTLPQATLPLFSSRQGQRPSVPILWTDMNRQLNGLWITPGDEHRWGANHFDVNRWWPKGSHVGSIDGAVQWVDGSEIVRRFSYASVGYFW